MALLSLQADGSSCDDGNACTVGDFCQSGTCTSDAIKPCFAADSCHGVGSCDPSTGSCSSPTLVSEAHRATRQLQGLSVVGESASKLYLGWGAQCKFVCVGHSESVCEGGGGGDSLCGSRQECSCVEHG